MHCVGNPWLDEHLSHQSSGTYPLSTNVVTHYHIGNVGMIALKYFFKIPRKY